MSVIGFQSLFAQGIQQKSILLGGHLPLSGSLEQISDLAKGADAYFRYINEQGGVHGRQIQYQYYDDQLAPALAQEIAQDFILNQQVFAMFGSIEPEQYSKVTRWIAQMDVPNLFLFSRSPNLYKLPLVAPFMPDTVTESRILGRYIATQNPQKRVLIWSRNDPYHQVLTKTLSQELKKYNSPVKVVTHLPFLKTVHEHLLKIQKSQADVLVIFFHT